MKAPFTSEKLFREEFNRGLLRLAGQGELGPFILACANASFEHLFDDFREVLHQQYQALYQRYRQAFLAGINLDVVDEDLLVFLKLHAIGFDHIEPSIMRREGLWKMQFNHLRSFRPRRITQFVHQGMWQAYDEDDFNFNKPFMARECFWQGELLGRQIDLFYNKYPFADLHGLLVMDRQQCRPQLLERDDHQYIFELAAALQPGMPGVGFGYNSYGAYASVNHLHFQMFVDPEGLPVTDWRWRHNGGDEEYPAGCHAFADMQEAWVCIQQLHDQAQPYNLLYVAERVFVYPRRTQGMVAVPDWSSGFTWYELSGAMICFNYDDYSQLQSAQIADHLAALRVQA
jgi:ATP adenylyltransferase/5',5'''-P-1,P-4-tetraphosphate phosphorylase II